MRDTIRPRLPWVAAKCTECGVTHPLAKLWSFRHTHWLCKTCHDKVRGSGKVYHFDSLDDHLRNVYGVFFPCGADDMPWEISSEGRGSG